MSHCDICRFVDFKFKFVDFCSRHTVGVAGDDIMFHILIITRDSEVIMFSPRVFVCVCVCVCLSMSVTMFVRTI